MHGDVAFSRTSKTDLQKRGYLFSRLQVTHFTGMDGDIFRETNCEVRRRKPRFMGSLPNMVRTSSLEVSKDWTTRWQGY